MDRLGFSFLRRRFPDFGWVLGAASRSLLYVVQVCLITAHMSIYGNNHYNEMPVTIDSTPYSAPVLYGTVAKALCSLVSRLTGSGVFYFRNIVRIW